MMNQASPSALLLLSFALATITKVTRITASTVSTTTTTIPITAASSWVGYSVRAHSIDHCGIQGLLGRNWGGHTDFVRLSNCAAAESLKNVHVIKASAIDIGVLLGPSALPTV